MTSKLIAVIRSQITTNELLRIENAKLRKEIEEWRTEAKKWEDQVEINKTNEIRVSIHGDTVGFGIAILDNSRYIKFTITNYTKNGRYREGYLFLEDFMHSCRCTLG